MRYPASEKLEIIKIVEQSHLPAKKTLDQLGIARRTFYRWYDRYSEGEPLRHQPQNPRHGGGVADPVSQFRVCELGPLLWQFANGKKFEPDDFAAFLSLLPASHQGVALRHAVEVRHPSFVVPEFAALCRRHGVAICHADHFDYPEIADVTADFIYSRLQKGADSIPTAYTEADLAKWASTARQWSEGKQPDGLAYADPLANSARKPRDVFVYFIHEGKVNAPQAAMAFQQLVD